jgi:hypothetical protein
MFVVCHWYVQTYQVNQETTNLEIPFNIEISITKHPILLPVHFLPTHISIIQPTPA